MFSTKSLHECILKSIFFKSINANNFHAPFGFCCFDPKQPSSPAFVLVSSGDKYRPSSSERKFLCKVQTTFPL